MPLITSTARVVPRPVESALQNAARWRRVVEWMGLPGTQPLRARGEAVADMNVHRQRLIKHQPNRHYVGRYSHDGEPVKASQTSKY